MRSKLTPFRRIKEGVLGISEDIDPKYWYVQAGQGIDWTDEIVEKNTLINCLLVEFIIYPYIDLYYIMEQLTILRA